MNNQNRDSGCTWGSVLMAALIGLLVAILCRFFAEMSWTGSIFSGLIAFIFMALFFVWAFCRDLPGMKEPGTAGVEAGSAGGSGSGGSGSGGSGSGGSAAAAVGAAGAAAVAGAAVASSGATATAGQSGSDAAKEAAAAEAAAKEAAAAEAAAKEAAAAEAAAKEAATSAAAAKEAATSAAAAKEAAAKEAAAKEAAAAKSAGSDGGNKDYDGDGTVEGKDEGTRPEALTAAREGGPDNLKEIKGIGPKLEKLCHSLGFYHFDQVANWTADEVAWVDANLEGFRGRVTRDRWVEQAKVLAAGGETEFSKRVEDGDVY